MKYTLTLFFILFYLFSFSQAATLNSQPGKTPKCITFITKVDIANATKEGIYLNEYGQLKNLNGKTIKVTGKVTIVKGLNSEPKEYDKNGQEIIKQGRSEDSKHILSPKIKIIK